jgi:hypothetical protein
MSKAWLEVPLTVPLTVFRVIIYYMNPAAISEGTKKAMSEHSALFNETSKPHPIANRPNGGEHTPAQIGITI